MREETKTVTDALLTQWGKQMLAWNRLANEPEIVSKVCVRPFHLSLTVVA
jgi:hypothetical protein